MDTIEPDKLPVPSPASGALVTRAWLTMQQDAIRAASWTLQQDIGQLQAALQERQAKLSTLQGSQRAYEWMLSQLMAGKLGKMPESLNGE